MKLTFYFDIAPWMTNSDYVFVTAKPSSEKSSDATRYKITVEVPDPQKPDVVLPDQKAQEM